MITRNPFDITFGKEPYALISRQSDLSQAYRSFSDEQPNSQVYILSGIRGSGKTVAMTTIEENYRKSDHWIVVELNSEDDMLEQLAAKLIDEGHLKKLFLKGEFQFSFHGLSFSLKGEKPINSVSSLLKKEFEYLKKKGFRVLVGIDEAVNSPNMRYFTQEFQILLRGQFPIFLLMTGLYQNIASLSKDKGNTFLLRAPKIFLSPLNLLSIQSSYAKIFDLDMEKAAELARFTKGYAFAYQLLGSILFEKGKRKLDGDVIQQFQNAIYDRAYSLIYFELSKTEKKVINEACIDPSNEHVLSALKLSASQLSNTKKILSRKGILEERRGEFVFALPRFEEVIERLLMVI